MDSNFASGLSQFFAQWGIIIIMLVALIAMFIFSSRSNKKRQQKYQSMIDELKPGTRVRTIGGIFGTITNVKDDVVFVSVGPDKARLVFSKQAIASIENAPVEATLDGSIVDTEKK